MDLWLYPLIIAAGCCCGFINVLAGSGSLITLPVLIFAGLPANVANGTNRIAILFQNIVAVHGFQKQGVLDFKRGKWLMLPAVLGALLGAQIAVDLDERMMRFTIGCIMVFMLPVIALRPKRWLEARSAPSSPSWYEGLGFFFIGIYGGFIQAGIGIFLLLLLVLLSGYDLIQSNALKVLIILGFTPFALAIFVIHDQVHWRMGITMALGNMIGARLGTKAAVKGGARLVRWFLLGAVALSALKLFWDSFFAG